MSEAPPSASTSVSGPFTGQSDFAWLLRDALPASGEMTAAVLSAAAHYLDQGLAPPDVPDAFCNTHWMPLVPESWPACPQSAHAPRHALEAAVLAVACAAAQSDIPLLRDARIVGLEWWLQEQWADDLPKEWHTDKAVGRVGVSDGVDGGIITRRPLLSSVLYLCDCGGPTAVVASRAESLEATVDEAKGAPLGLSVAFPSCRSLLLFDGSLLHAVLHTPDAPLGRRPSDVQPRRTFLVNFWVDSPPPGAYPPVQSAMTCHMPLRSSKKMPDASCVIAVAGIAWIR